MNQIFKKTLREELYFQNLTVKELAFKTNLSQRTLEGYLGSRNSMPPADVAVTIAKALNVSVEFLVTGSNCNNNSPQDTYERLLINNYRKMNQRDKNLLLEISNNFLNIE